MKASTRKGWEEFVTLTTFEHEHQMAINIEPRAEGFALVIRCTDEPCGAASKFLQGDSDFLAHLVPKKIRRATKARAIRPGV